MTRLQKQRTMIVLWILSTFLAMCGLSESLRRDLHKQGALFHYPEDYCPENWK